MRAPFSALTQSRFFHNAFNSAIFDGPVRIYFVQFHETNALKIYFALQDQLAPMFNSVKDYSKTSAGSTVLIMVYPTEEVFKTSFPNHSQEQINGNIKLFGQDIWEEETILGLIADDSEDLIPKIIKEVKLSFETWSNKRAITDDIAGELDRWDSNTEGTEYDY